MSGRSARAGAVCWMAAAVVAGGWSPAVGEPAPAAEKPAGAEASARAEAVEAAVVARWKGSVFLGPGAKLGFAVVFRRGAGGEVLATLDIPEQGLKGGALRDVRYEPPRMGFTLRTPQMNDATQAVFTGLIDPEGRTALAHMKQSGVVFAVEMEKSEGEVKASDLLPNRPQNPRPPFPYTSREVTYVNAADGTKLAGTLTIPQGPGPHPAAVMITGSGAQDRDETIVGHKPFWVIADYLSRRGVAVLRADDRGVGGSTGSVSDSTTADFAGDALAAVDVLRGMPEIDPERIGLIGHSEGGIVGPMAAAREPQKVAFVVMLAGTGLPGDEILAMQSERIVRASGAGEEEARRAGETSRRLTALLRRGAGREEIVAAMREIGAEQMASMFPAEGREPGRKPDGGALKELIEKQADGMLSPWMTSFIRHDPRPDLMKVRAPVLALFGEKDLQVPPEENLAAVRRALEEGGNTRVTAAILPGLNHLFQPCEDGSPSRYASIETTFSEDALKMMSDWIARAAGRP
ncbi:MAG: alpha/beta fold hydrolase [Phycisphaerales bacterium]|nr:alpha/beta fold hydrolase [Phycisphaerales bacterium]